MPYSSISFIFIFLPVALLAYYLVPQKKRNLVLVIESLIFYAWGEPVYVVLLFLSAMLHYFCGRDIEEKREHPMLARKSLVYAVVINVLILGFFKYYGFLMESINAISPVNIPYRELSLPVGISFFTLRGISYLVDIYRGEARAQKQLVPCMLYLSMFPQMLAGPIDLYVDMEAQLKKRVVSLQKLGAGAMVFICGFAKKVILAQKMHELQLHITEQQIGTFSVATAWIGCIAFAFYIYFEWSGFTDMAMGLARMFGFEIKPNFDHPYTAKSVSEFWTRWNVSLNVWFREYIFRPLGSLYQDIAAQIWIIVLVGFLSGLWYGAKWKFIWWGMYFGIVLLIEQYLLRTKLKRWPNWICHVYAFVMIMIGWTFFFSPDVGLALDYIGVMFGMGARGFVDQQAFYYVGTNWLLLVLSVLGSSARGHRLVQAVIEIPKSDRGRRLLTWLVYVGIFFVGLAFLVVPTKELSKADNRRQAERPHMTLDEIYSGDYMEKYEEYLSDQFIGRELLRDIKVGLSRLGGSREENGVLIGKDGQLLEDIAVPKQEVLSENLEAIETFAKKHKDIRTTMMIIPDAANIWKEKLPFGYHVADQKRMIAQVKRELEESVNWIDTESILNKYKDESIYYKTDKHWTTTGAYYVFRHAAEKMGIRENLAGKFATYPITADFNGDLSAKSGCEQNTQEIIDIYSAVEGDSDVIVNFVDEKRKTTSLYDSSKLKSENPYEVFLGGDTSVIDIKTVSESKQRLLVIKDSFANSFLPFLAPYYREIVVVDPQYYSGTIDQIMETYRITDILYLYGGNTFFQDNHISGVLNCGQ